MRTPNDTYCTGKCLYFYACLITLQSVIVVRWPAEEYNCPGRKAKSEVDDVLCSGCHCWIMAGPLV